jgi:hypothetical protein
MHDFPAGHQRELMTVPGSSWQSPHENTTNYRIRGVECEWTDHRQDHRCHVAWTFPSVRGDA